MTMPNCPTVVSTSRTVALLAGLYLAGCAQTKNVTLDTTPQGAALVVTRMENGSPTGVVPLPQPGQTSPVEMELNFGRNKNIAYQVTASKTQYLQNQITVGLEPQSQTNYTIPLTQFEKDLPAVRFGPSTYGGVHRLVPRIVGAVGYLIPDTEPEDNPAISQPVEVKLFESAGGDVDYPTLAASPSNDVLVFQRAERGAGGQWSSKLYRVSSHGGSPVRLTGSDAQEYTPAFSFNGDYVIFSSDNTSDNATLWKIKVDGGGTLITNLTRTDALDYAPSVGQQLMAYTSLPPRAFEPQVWVSRLDGSQAGFIANGSSPQVSPDNRHILFLRKGKDGHNQLWRVDVDGSNLTQLTQNSGYDVADPRWKPDDGQWIAYSSYEGMDEHGINNSDIWLISADGSGNKIQLTRNGSFDGSPAWDRSGKAIYFRSNRGGTWNIWRADIRLGVVDTGTK